MSSPLPPLPVAGNTPWSALAAWPRSAQLTAAFLLGVVVTLLSVQAVALMRPPVRPADLDASSGYRIDLNRASRAELLQVPGFGPATVERIDHHRADHGPFRTVDDLVEVPGIGPTTVQRVRPWVSVAPTEESAATPSKGASAHGERSPGATRSKEAPTDPIDPNRASLEELQRLPGIGPKLAQRIIDERERKAFRAVDDLRRVSGIGPKTLDKLRPHLEVAAPGPSAATTPSLP